MIRAGLQIPNFTYPDVAPDELFERVAAVAQTAEQSGFDTVMVMDHFYQLPLLGPPEHEMFEAYTLLGAIAGVHYRVKDVINSPAPVRPGGPPIMIGGQGEKKTMRLMAEHAEMANFTSGFDEIPHKLEVLAGHCERAGRDIATINKTPLAS